MATTAQDLLHSSKLETPPREGPSTSARLTSNSEPHILKSSLNIQPQKGRQMAESKSVCVDPSCNLPRSPQTTSIAASEGVDQSLPFGRTLIAPLMSPLQNINNRYITSVTHCSGRKLANFTLEHPQRLDQRSAPMATVTGSPSWPKYENNGAPHGQVSSNSQCNWRSYTFVDVFVHNLPSNVTTFDLYQHFVQYGEIAIITIKNPPGGGWKNQADIRFKPPPKEAFWETSTHPFKDGSRCVSVGVELSSNQRENFTVQSPVDKEVFYNEEMDLDAKSIGFGVLTNPSTMMIMKKKQSRPESKVRFILNLMRKEIEVRFPTLTLTARLPLYDKYPWLRPEYRFCVSLDQDFSIIQVQEPDNKVSFVLHLDTPPPYSKKQHQEVPGSHVADARRWLEHDVWLRQTSIGDSHREGDGATTPTSLARSEGAINIGRWTTFRITFDEAERKEDQFRIMTKALRDFNVKIVSATDFEYVPPVPPIWEFVDKDLQAHAGITKSYAGDLSLLEESASLNLPFSVRYLLDVCISTGRLNEYVVRENFLQALIAAGEFKACNRLKLILDMPANKALVDPMSIFNNRKFRPILRKELKLPDNCALIYSVTVTATTMIFHAPSVEITNRIIRQYKQYADRFLRVRFEDDKYKGNSRIYANTTNKLDAIFRRVRRTMNSGIAIGGRKYEFLAWGNSQLREHGAYFFANVPNGLTASQIRAVMGQFDQEKVIAKRAARMGQCFSTTKPIKLRIPRVTRETLIDDVITNGYTFTDGVGQISPLLVDLINQELKLDDHTPSLLQFRLGGCKGVLAVSRDLKGIDIRLRKSQFKFDSDSNDLEVIRCSRFEGAHLNRQLILVLSALGVDDSVFLQMQDKEMRELEAAMSNDEISQAKLRADVDANKSTLELADMVDRGFRAKNDPFVTSLLQLWRAWSLKYLKEKAKLHVENGATLLGCVDDTKTLKGHYNYNQPLPAATYEERYAKLPEIFVQVETSESKRRRGKQKREGQTPSPPVYDVKEGICMIARNPSLHEGDIRVVKAVDVQALYDKRDVLVLPQTGDRDLSSMCSGGDLDGDDYVVIWAEDSRSRPPKFDLLPRIWNAQPMDYRAPEPLCAEGEITPAHTIEFFDQYMRNDFLGRIAHAHLAWADDHHEGIRSDQCIQLAHLHSQAVDYPKTGQPAKLPRALDRFEWPHFMEKKGGKKYTSRKVLGKLYDKVQRVKFVPNYRGKFDHRILNALEPSQAVRDQVEELKRDYDTSLRRIMAQHEIKTEFEVWSTFVLDHSKASLDYKFHEEIGNLSKSLKEEFIEAFIEAAGGRSDQDLQPYAVAAYQLVKMEVSQALEEVDKGEREEIPEQMPFMSFPWVLQETLGKLAMAAPDQAKNNDSPRASETKDGDRRDAEYVSGKKQPIQNKLQGDLFADPYQLETTSVDEDEKDATAQPTEPHFPKPDPNLHDNELHRQNDQLPPISWEIPFSASSSSSAGPFRSNANSSSTIRPGIASLLDDDCSKSFSVQAETWNGMTLTPTRARNQQSKESEPSPPTQRSSDSGPLVSISKEASLALSLRMSMASTDNEIKSNHLEQLSEDTSAMPHVVSARPESLYLGQKSYEDGDGIYRSKHRRPTVQSGSSFSPRGSYQISDERHSAIVITSPGVRGDSPKPRLPSPPEPSPVAGVGRGGRPAAVTSNSVGTTLSARAAFRQEIDSDEEGEVIMYGDPARITL